MPTALDARGQPAPTDKSTGPTRRIRLTRDVAKHLDRHVPAITAKLRAELDAHRETGSAEAPAEIHIDLSRATEVPPSQLTLLTTLLRRTIGRTVTLSGVRPMILNSLTAHGLPDGVVVVDTRGRRWGNSG